MKRFIFSMLLVFSLFCFVSCSQSAEEESEPDSTPIVTQAQMDYSYWVGTLEPVDPDYDLYNMPASENGMGGTFVQIDGKVDRVDTENGVVSLIVMDDNKNPYACQVGFIDDGIDLDLYDSFVGAPCALAGTYAGFSDVLNSPCITAGFILCNDQFVDVLGIEEQMNADDVETDSYTFYDFTIDFPESCEIEETDDGLSVTGRSGTEFFMFHATTLPLDYDFGKTVIYSMYTSSIVDDYVEISSTTEETDDYVRTDIKFSGCLSESNVTCQTTFFYHDSVWYIFYVFPSDDYDQSILDDIFKSIKYIG